MDTDLDLAVGPFPQAASKACSVLCGSPRAICYAGCQVWGAHPPASPALSASGQGLPGLWIRDLAQLQRPQCSHCSASEPPGQEPEKKQDGALVCFSKAGDKGIHPPTSHLILSSKSSHVFILLVLPLFQDLKTEVT